MIAKILAIDVPKEYRWNMETVSNTPGDIILACSLSPKSGWQMMSKYCQDESIYDLQKGIYGMVLDGVWQYVLKSPHKLDLCKALKQEMEDNIGMCSQGNLSRLCNILSGYLDGITQQEPVSEVLGRMLPKLLEIDDINERLSKAHKVFVENNVDESEYQTWLDPLLADQDYEYELSMTWENDKVTAITLNKV
jgi:hypothetical protein